MTFDIRQENTCPLGGTWYKCGVDFGEFSGCCTMEPCFPGGGCPKEKDLTPGRNTVTYTKASATPTASSQVSDVSFVKVPITTTPFSPVPSSTIVSTTASVAVNYQPSESSIRSSGPINQKLLPLAAIIGAAVGAIALLGLALFLLICLRRRKQKGTYQAPIYVSPYNTSSDMSQMSASSYRTKARKNSLEVQQLDSRDFGRPRHMADDASQRFAELPGEPVVGAR